MDWAMTERGHSQRRACSLVGIDPRVYRYRSSRPYDGELRQRLRELAAERRRFGYRRLHLLLAREGVVVNRKKLYRLYREERLVVRKRALGTRTPMTIPQGANQRWSVDFASDTLVDSRRFRVFCVIDDFKSGFRESWTESLNIAVTPYWWSRTTAPSSSPMRCSDGNRTTESIRTTSLPASPFRTGWWRASSAGCVMSA